MKDMKAKVLPAREITKYQEGSVVSREIINKGSGGVTFFAFDEGQSLSEHTVPFDAMVYVTEGSAAVTIEGEVYRPEKDEFIIMPAGRPHSIKAEEKFKMMLVMIKQ